MAETAVEFRPAVPADLNDLIELELSDAPDRPDAAVRAARVQCDRFDRQDREQITLFVGEHKGEIVCELALRWPGQPDRFGRTDREDLADIEDVRVLPGYRNAGIGTEMIAHVEWLCMREGIDGIGAAFDPSTQTRSMLWFERMGYIRKAESYVIGEGASPDTLGAGDVGPAVRVDMTKEF